MRLSLILGISRFLGFVLWLGVVRPIWAEPTPSTPTVPTALPEAQLRKRLQDVGTLEEEPAHGERIYPLLELEPPYHVILRAAREHPEPEHVLAALRKQYGLNPTAARDLLDAQLLVLPPRGSWTAVSLETTRTALTLYLDAARQAPGSRVVLAAALDLPLAFDLPDPEFQTRILKILETAPDPIEQALSFATLQGQFGSWGLSFATLAVSRKPETLPRALTALGTQRGGRPATLFYLAAYQALRSRPAEPFPSVLAERLLFNLLQEGQLPRALEVLRQLPASQREALLAGRPASKDSPGDFRIDLAGALLVMGEEREARSWRDAALQASPALLNASDNRKACEFERKSKALASRLEPQTGADPFPLLHLVDTCEQGSDHPWLLLLDTALQGHYPQKARRSLEYRVEYEQTGVRHLDIPLRAQLSFLDEAQRLLDAGDQERLARLRAALAAVPTPAAEAASKQADPVASRLRELLATPASSPFSEHPLAEAPKLKPATRWTPSQDVSNVPRGFHPLRAERSGKHVLLLAVSQRLDPTGEVSGGGYWLLESRDEGRTWEPPLYTGLREYRPYELATKSSLPMLEGDTLRLEASMRELDEQHITFPPVDLRTKREKKGLYLEARLSALRQDTDGDGLTDLTEERLLTDPKAADTDADGLADGEDPLPQVPTAPRETASPRASLLSAFMARLRGDESIQPGLEVGLPAPGESPHGPRLPKGESPASQDDVLFLEMDRGALKGAWMPSRTLVLSTEELSRAQERFGHFYPLRIDLFINEKGDEALIDWNEHWRGGRFSAHREKGQWVFVSLSEWIT